MNVVAQLARSLFPARPRAVTTLIVASVFAASALIGMDLASVDTLPVQATDESVRTTVPVVTAPTSSTVPIPLRALSPGVDPGWTPVARYSTDFHGTVLDTTNWDVYNSKGNAGVGLRRPSAITVAGDSLRITGKGEVSGGLSHKTGQVYGRWVIRAKMEKGNGYGPAILLWPDSERWPEDGEIDIVELPKGDRSEAIMTTHWGADNSQDSGGHKDDFSEWHTYAVDWLPDRIVYYIDGVERHRTTNPEAIPHKPMHLAIQNDVGACKSWIGCRDATTPSAVTLSVSSVRVYASTTAK